MSHISWGGEQITIYKGVGGEAQKGKLEEENKSPFIRVWEGKPKRKARGGEQITIYKGVGGEAQKGKLREENKSPFIRVWEGKPKRESSKRTVSVSGGSGPLPPTTNHLQFF